MPRVLTCLDYDTETQTCNVEAWAEQPSLLPQMTVEQGTAIGQQFAVGLLAIAAVKVFLNPKLHRKPS